MSNFKAYLKFVDHQGSQRQVDSSLILVIGRTSTNTSVIVTRLGEILYTKSKYLELLNDFQNMIQALPEYGLPHYESLILTEGLVVRDMRAEEVLYNVLELPSFLPNSLYPS